MGKVDILSKQYIERREVFADIVNTLEYGGEQVVLPEMLREEDSTETQVIITNRNKGRMQKGDYVERFRDSMKGVCQSKGGIKNYAIFGIEEQTEVHYGAPVKLLLYDALNYSNQVKRIADHHRMKGEAPADAGEFLSGIYREDKLVPVKTLVVYFNSKPWDGPRSLHDMPDMEGWQEREKEMFPDYPLRILEPARLTEEDLERMHSDLKLVMGFIKYSADKEALDKYINKHDEFHTIDWESAALLNEVCALKLDMKEGKGVTDMCKAIQDMQDETRTEGREALLMSQIQKKMAKGDSMEKIAEDLVEDVEVIEKLCKKNLENGL